MKKGTHMLKKIALLLTVVLAMTGCGSASNGNTKESETVADTGTSKIVFWQVDNNESEETLAKQQALFDQIKEVSRLNS